MSTRTSQRKKHEVSVFPAPESFLGQRYYYMTQRPWPSLVFVLPMLIVFELMTYLRHGGHWGGDSELVAWHLITVMMNKLGANGFHYPGLVIVAILLAQHIAARHPWKFDGYIWFGMLGESIIWTLPLFVFSRVLHEAIWVGGAAARNEWIDQVVRGLGAGLYEELVFRLICITLLVIVLIDLFKLPRSAAAVFIILASAALFAAEHHPPFGVEPFDVARFTFRTAAGLYLAGLFIFRGFGIAAGCHAFYNIIVVTIDAVQS